MTILRINKGATMRKLIRKIERHPDGTLKSFELNKGIETPEETNQLLKELKELSL